MILGIGNDITDIRRIERAIERFGDRFLKRVFTTGELAKAESHTTMRHKRAGTLAKRYAAKEACLKALGIHNKGIHWHDMDVVSLPSGKPTLQLSGAAAAALAKLVPKGMKPQVDVTMSDEYPQAQAIVIISANPVE